MWHKLHVLISQSQLKWLKAESCTRGKSIAEIVRGLIDKERGRQDREQPPPK